jgi:hypothetical protein
VPCIRLARGRGQWCESHLETQRYACNRTLGAFAGVTSTDMSNTRTSRDYLQITRRRTQRLSTIAARPHPEFVFRRSAPVRPFAQQLAYYRGRHFLSPCVQAPASLRRCTPQPDYAWWCTARHEHWMETFPAAVALGLEIAWPLSF